MGFRHMLDVACTLNDVDSDRGEDAKGNDRYGCYDISVITPADKHMVTNKYVMCRVDNIIPDITILDESTMTQLLVDKLAAAD